MSKEWIADMSMDCDYDLTVSCVQLDLVDSPGADTEDQETESRLQRGLHHCSTRHHSAYTGLQARLPGLTQHTQVLVL